MVDISNLKSKLQKDNIPTELSNPDVWISTGNMALNHSISQRFDAGIPNRRTTMLFGPSGAGKSLILGHAAKDAQEKGYFIVYIDSEDAIDEAYLDRIGVNMEDDAFLPVRVSTIEETSKVISDLFQNTNPEDKVFVALDSLTMLETEQEFEKFEKSGELQNDQGLTAKKYKSMIKNVNAKIGSRDMFFVYSAHAYQNQEMFSGEKYNISGGSAQLYIPSISVLLDKLQLKETDGSGKKSRSVGFKMKTKIYKSRFSMLGDTCELHVPFNTGIDPYDGLLERLETLGIVEKKHAWYIYTDKNGEQHKFQSKNANEYLDMILDEMNASTGLPQETAEE